MKYVLKGLSYEFRMFRTSLNSLNQREPMNFNQLFDLLIKEEILIKELDTPSPNDLDFQVNYTN